MEFPKQNVIVKPGTNELEVVDVRPVDFLGLLVDQVARPLPNIGVAALPCTDLRLRYAVFVDGPGDTVHAGQISVNCARTIGQTNAQLNAQLQEQYEKFLESLPG